MTYQYNRYKSTRSSFEKSKETDGFKGWRKAQYRAQHGHCAWCYETFSYQDMDVDHITPVAAGGTNDFSNLVLACHDCNRNEDKKFDTTYNVPAYKKTLAALTYQQKQSGYAPEKLYWERPKWIGPNKYDGTSKMVGVVYVPLAERNVWNIEAPIVRDYSLVESSSHISGATGTIDTIRDTISDNSETIGSVIKWIFGIALGVFILYIIGVIIAASGQNSAPSSAKHCDEACLDAQYEKILQEEEDKRRKEMGEERAEARRWQACKAEGWSDEYCTFEY